MGCILQRPQEGSVQKVECVVCFNEATTVLYPCGHCCVCNECARQLSINDRERLGDLVYIKINIRKHNGLFCPLCRKLGLPTKIYPNMTEGHNTM